MRPNKSTRYALYAAMEMATAPPGEPVTATAVAERYGIPPTVMAKVFQQLVRAGIAAGTRGTGGGYRLARDPAEVTMLDVIQVFEPGPSPGGCLLAGEEPAPCPRPEACRLRRIFDEVDGLARNTFASITLATLVAPLHPVTGEPVPPGA